MDVDSFYTNVHMDFHTPDLQKEVGRDFEPEEFSRRLEKSDVESITFFTKGHHGNSYYDTKIGKKHPNLRRNLLKDVVDCCHRRGIEVIAYYTLVWDNYLGRKYPDWVQKDGKGERLTAENLPQEERWTYLCLNSPYPEEKIYPQIKEIINLGVDGFFFDILFYHPDACTCDYCLEEMEELGLDHESERDMSEMRRRNTLNFAERTTDFVKGLDEDLIVTYNHKEQPGYTAELQEYCDYLLIESLPAQWGYLHTPYIARYVRGLDVPFQGMTGVFHRSWGDFGTVKNENQLLYEISTSIAHGATTSVGDHLPPRGELEEGKYRTIGEAFKFAKRRKENLLGLNPTADVALYSEDNYDPSLSDVSDSVVGGSKVLIESHILFDVVDSSVSGKLDDYGIVIVPSDQSLPGELAEGLDGYVKAGGNLIAFNTGGISKGNFTLDCLGIKYHSLSPYSFNYLLLPDDLSDGIPEGPMVSYDTMTQVMTCEAETVAKAMIPTTQRFGERGFSHRQAPPEEATPYPAITENEYGAGRAIYVSAPILGDFYDKDYFGHRRLVENLADRCLSGGRSLSTDAPSNVEVTMLEGDGKQVVNLINFGVKRPGGGVPPQIESVNPVQDIELRVKGKTPSRVSKEPESEELDWTREDDMTVTKIGSLKTHCLVEFEY